MPHTPGPWIADPDGFVRRRLDEFTSVHIATIYGAQEGARDANTQLIACAPELLEALKHAKQFIQNGIEFGYIRLPEMLQDSAHETLPLIQQAIAKAESKPSADPGAL